MSLIVWRLSLGLHLIFDFIQFLFNLFHVGGKAWISQAEFDEAVQFNALHRSSSVVRRPKSLCCRSTNNLFLRLK